MGDAQWEMVHVQRNHVPYLQVALPYTKMAIQKRFHYERATLTTHAPETALLAKKVHVPSTLPQPFSTIIRFVQL